MPADVMTFSPGLVIGGKYRLERPLASGGMGSLWVARHTQLGALVAMKFMEATSTTSPIARARFEREARSAASLRSPHVVTVQDYGLDGDAPFIVMELLQGEDLRKRLNREKRVPLEALSRILAQTARGLRVAHDAKLVHRDLKPANVFLARIDEEEVVKLLDFGIAKELTPAVGETTKTGELMGSPHYMSPEQVRALKDIDHRSDLWSLSVIVFRAATGRLPFNGEVIGEVIGQILADPVPRATVVAPDLPPALDAFFDRGFSRDREQRFQSAREMAEAFAVIVANAGGQPESVFPSGAYQGMPSSRPPMTSLATMHDGSLPGSPSSSVDILPAPTMPPPMYPSVSSPSIADTGAPLSGALGPTGGPVMHTAPPPPLRRAPIGKWSVVAGAVAVGAVGAAVLVLRGGSHGAQPAAGIAGVAAPVSMASVGTVTVPVAPVAASAPLPGPAETADAEGDAAAEASASASARPLGAPAPTGKGSWAKPAPPKPKWGF
jgi:eukaryotic-like serine/threonine-protein kinase